MSNCDSRQHPAQSWEEIAAVHGLAVIHQLAQSVVVPRCDTCQSEVRTHSHIGEVLTRDAVERSIGEQEPLQRGKVREEVGCHFNVLFEQNHRAVLQRVKHVTQRELVVSSDLPGSAMQTAVT